MAKRKKDFWERGGKSAVRFRAWDFRNKRFITDADVVFQGKTEYKDINGREIYEGDILETDEAGWIAVVVFGDGRFSLEDRFGGFSAFPNWEACKVIGNVYENPELLEK